MDTQQTHDDRNAYDVIIVGGGPTGLTAAMYAAREGISVVVLESNIVGGMAAITEQIDNYPGFRNGVGGLQLTEEMHEQALRFGAEVEVGVKVEQVVPNNGHFTVRTADKAYDSKAVIVATGSDYRHMDVPGEAEMIGRGIHFCATCDAPFYKDKSVIVVGGGNSAVQEALFIARFARHITMLVRASEFHASEILVDELNKLENITVCFDSPIVNVISENNHVKGITTKQLDGSEVLHTADGVFVFIGLLPNGTNIVNFELDERGFIKTDTHYMTSIPGVFACGDIRSGSTWQIASAVGEGAAAVLALREYLKTL